MHVQSDDLLAKVRQKHNIAQRELIKQAHEYINHRISQGDLAVKIDAYFRYGAYEQPVTDYCNGILEGRIKL